MHRDSRDTIRLNLRIRPAEEGDNLNRLRTLDADAGERPKCSFPIPNDNLQLHSSLNGKNTDRTI